MFLNRNAENIMKKSNEYYFMKNGAFDCQKPYEVEQCYQKEHVLFAIITDVK